MKLNIKNKRLFFILVLFLFGGILILFPAVRQLIIEITEQFIFRRNLNDSKWLNFLLRLSISVICISSAAIIYVCFFRCRINNFFYNMILFYRNNRKKRPLQNMLGALSPIVSYVFKVFEYILIILLSYSVFYVAYLIYNNACVSLGDPHYVLAPLSQGESIKFFVFTHIKRFNPIALQEFNILLLSNNKNIIQPVFFLMALKYILFCTFTYLALIKTEGKLLSLIGCTVCCLSLYPLLLLFFNVYSTEATLLLLFSAFIFFYNKAVKNGDKKYNFIICAAICIVATYTKEPAFVVFMTIAFVNFIFRHKKISPFEKYINVFFIVNAIIFLIVFFVYTYSETNGSYTEGRTVKTHLIALYNFLSITYWLPVLLPVTRIIHFFKIRRLEVNFTDCVLLSGIAYGMFYVLLKFHAQYYFIPAFFLILFALINYLGIYYKLLGNWLKSTPPPFHWANLCNSAITQSLKLCSMILLWLVLFWHITAGNINKFNNYVTGTRNANTFTFELLKLCEEKGYKIFFWIPEYEEGNNKYTWARGEHFTQMVPFAYFVYVNSPIDVNLHRKIFYDELMLHDNLREHTPFSITSNFNDFLEQKSILLLMPESPTAYANKPWLNNQEQFIMAPTVLLNTLIKREDIYELELALRPWNLQLDLDEKSQ